MQLNVRIKRRAAEGIINQGNLLDNTPLSSCFLPNPAFEKEFGTCFAVEQVTFRKSRGK
jgi:hypothetical protein